MLRGVTQARRNLMHLSRRNPRAGPPSSRQQGPVSPNHTPISSSAHSAGLRVGNRKVEGAREQNRDQIQLGFEVAKHFDPRWVRPPVL